MTQYVDLTLVLAFWVSMGSQGCRYPHPTLLADITSKTSEGVEGVDDSTYLFQEKRISLPLQQYEEHHCQNIDTTDTPIAKCLILLPPRVSIGCRYSAEGFGKGIDEAIPLWISRSEMDEGSQTLSSLSKNFRLGGHYHEKNQLYQEDPCTSARGVNVRQFILAEISLSIIMNYGGLKMDQNIAKEEQISNKPNYKQEIVYLTVPVEYLTAPVAYKIRSLLNALEPLAETANNEDLKELIDAVNSVLYERFGEPQIEYMDGIKKLPSIEILSFWLDMYCAFLDNSWGQEDWVLVLVLASELAERGLGRYTEKLAEAAAAENIGQELSDSEREEFADLLNGMTEAELLEEWDFYSVILDLCNRHNVKDRHRRDMIWRRLFPDGLKKLRRKYSLRSCN